MNPKLPVIGFAAFSGTGKTTLLTHLIPQLKRDGMNPAVVKHAHHSFDIDTPGKDSYELRLAGATQVLVSSAQRFAKIIELDEEKTLAQCLAEVDRAHCDVILVEGYKRSTIHKIELHRPALGFPLLCQVDENIVAVATDEKLRTNPGVPELDLNDIPAIGRFIRENIRLFDTA